jgi:N-methylhydantoinase A/oxoprolinase/acetone carboxylase beta subunit
MKIGIGIDTGGTYTDAIALDYETGSVLAKGKALTTRENLTIGIGEAIDLLSPDYLKQAKIIALSTTLATNACVEDKGGRARLIMLGTTRKIFDFADAEKKYGLRKNDTLCLETRDQDLAELLEGASEWIGDSDILSVVELDAPINGAGVEKAAGSLLESRYQIPVVLGSDLVNGLNVMERGATALLNARLLPIIEEFVSKVADALTARGVNVPAMIVRSDGSLMIDSLSRHRPVETILSGPAASVLGGRALSGSGNCIIVDMGGTTTDISMIRDGVPAMAERGIRIGSWHTLVKGVFMDTFALGGDSAIRMKNDRLVLERRRVLPLCAAAEKFPAILEDLNGLPGRDKPHSHPVHEFFYLLRDPADNKHKYNRHELALCKALQAGPVMIGNLEKTAGIDIYNLKSDRLEAEGVIMRCGLTPTDIMHIRGDFTKYQREAPVLAARYFMGCLKAYTEPENELTQFANDVYDLVKRRLFSNIARVLLAEEYPELFRKKDAEQIKYLIRQAWKQWQSRRHQPDFQPFAGIRISTSATLVGIGAPTHVFLPEVARALGTDCVIPEHAEVANAVGAAIADITTRVSIEISPDFDESGLTVYTVRDPGGKRICKSLDDAIEAARQSAIRRATAEARRRGALGELKVTTQVKPLTAFTNYGQEIDLGASVQAAVSARILD